MATSTWELEIIEELDSFCLKLEEKIYKKQQQVEASKKKYELETKLAQEMKINSELTQQLAELSRRGGELERVCATFESLTIAESDRHRLDNAKEMYQVAKEITGLRLDFSASANIAKGYVKNEARRLLQPFEHEAGDSETLWTLIKNTATPGGAVVKF
ncbi:unnamed protein product [Parnassius apollo]|uniref:(apollo) hypothetical protein n=1 Tax=Parnassius apollo TaxID=110799 RepID=A0A8S3XLS2_PARAO|nr:unnamed protein product [Parnassius apollo]